MSHMLRIKTSLSNELYIVRALERMGISAKVMKHSVEDYEGVVEDADISIVNGKVGLKRLADGTYSLVGDFYNVDIKLFNAYYEKHNKFIKHLSVNYAIAETEDLLNQQGFQWTENQEAAVDHTDGLIHLTFER